MTDDEFGVSQNSFEFSDLLRIIGVYCGCLIVKQLKALKNVEIRPGLSPEWNGKSQSEVGIKLS